MKQQTVIGKVHFEGVGLHTGHKIQMSILPSNADSGISFKRIDVNPHTLIKVDIDNVSHTQRGTTLSSLNIKVHTVEHILSALYALEIDNAIIELDNNEVPILDGSSKLFIDKILKVGIKTLDKEANYINITEPIECVSKNNDSKISILPYDKYKVSFFIDFENKLIGKQSFILNSLNEYIKEISSARTFCTIEEVIQLRKSDLIKGGNSDNAIIFSDKNISKKEEDKINDMFELDISKNIFLTKTKKSLKYKDEPVRHKILDVIGDISLIGKRIKGHLISHKSGHALNIELVKKINKEYCDKNNIKNKFVFNKDQIKEIIPHRAPFLFIDNIVDGQDKKYVVATKFFNGEESFFKGHFPGRPIVPGVILIECMAQTSCFLDMKTVDNRKNKLMLLSVIKSAKFMREVIPGDTINIRTELIQYKLKTARVRGIISIDDEIVAKAEWMATLVER